MKRILTIAIVICLSVTMTCSSMAVEPRYKVLQCSNCGGEEIYGTYTEPTSSMICVKCGNGTVTRTVTIYAYICQTCNHKDNIYKVYTYTSTCGCTYDPVTVYY